MRNALLRHRRRWTCLGILLAAVVLGCGGDDNPTPPNHDPVPDFTLLDINPHSPTQWEYVALSDFEGQIIMIYNGSANCSTCRGELDAVSLAIDSLAQEGITGITGMMIIPTVLQTPTDTLDLGRMQSTLPVLRDTVDVVHGGSAVLRLIDCEDYHTFLFVDRDGNAWKKTTVGAVSETAYDFRPSEPENSYAQLLAWLRQLDAQE